MSDGRRAAPRRSTAPRCWSPRWCRPTEPLTFADLQEACDLPKSTTSRMLTALERSELLERDDDGSYVAGSLFWLYAARHDPGEDLVRLAGPMLDGDRRGDPRDRQPQHGPRRPRRAGRAGRLAVPPRHPRLDRRSTSPPTAPSLGKVFLPGTSWPCPTSRSSGDRRPRSPTPTRCAPTRARTRKRGWAITVDELEVGLAGVAVPVSGTARPGRRGPRRLGTDHPAGAAGFDELGPLLTDHATELTDLLRRHQHTIAKEGAA